MLFVPIKYTVSFELKTVWWKRVLRFFRLIPPRLEFTIDVRYDLFNVGDVMCLENNLEVLVISKSND